MSRSVVCILSVAVVSPGFIKFCGSGLQTPEEAPILPPFGGDPGTSVVGKGQLAHLRSLVRISPAKNINAGDTIPHSLPDFCFDHSLRNTAQHNNAVHRPEAPAGTHSMPRTHIPGQDCTHRPGCSLRAHKAGKGCLQE